MGRCLMTFCTNSLEVCGTGVQLKVAERAQAMDVARGKGLG